MKNKYPEKEDGLSVLLESMLGGSSDQSIRSQEKRGQSQFVNSEVLPRKFNSGNRQQLEQMGVVFGEEADDLFIYVTLPDGWKKEPTDHSMWSKLIDEQGRERASIFYKAAFYDRDAFLNISRRFGCSYRPTHGYESPNYRHGTWVGVVTDCGDVIWRTAELEPEPEYKIDKDAWIEWSNARKDLVKEARQWLYENYPDWENPVAYWDM